MPKQECTCSLNERIDSLMAQMKKLEREMKSLKESIKEKRKK